jgi:NAD-dependent dihydropyrimidine dehydrogenase PreA subunit
VVESRKIILIDEGLCDGCGACVPSCAEGAIRIENGKARLVADALCDGLGACLGECPKGALTVVTREAEPFSEAAVEQSRQTTPAAPVHHPPATCPSAKWLVGEGAARAGTTAPQWPVQLRLISPAAPFLRGSELLLTADCVPVADPAFRDKVTAPGAVAIACPKFDDPEASVSRLAEIVAGGGITGIRVLRMEVPCCGGLTRLARMAVEAAGSDLRVAEEIVTVGR